MGFKEISTLRKSGKLEEALQLGLTEYNSNPNNVYITCEIVRVYCDMLEQICDANHFKESLCIFNKCLDLNLDYRPQNFLVDNLKWCIIKLGWKLIKYNGDKSLELRQLLEIAVKLPVFKNKANSVVINMFKEAFEDKRDDFYRLVDWQGFDNFIETEDQNDYSSQSNNGYRTLSLAEDYYGAYAKHLLPYQKNGQEIFNKERVIEFLPLIESLREHHPDYIWIPYHQAPLEKALGNQKKAIDLLIPFVRLKKNEFWAWDRFGDCLEDSDEKLSCYAKGLQCKTKAEMVLKLRSKIIPFLITRKEFAAAKFEVEEICKVRSKNDWKISQQIIGWQREPWYLNTTTNQDNNLIYKKYSKKAEDLLFGDVPETEILIIWKDSKKQLAGFVTETDDQESRINKGPFTSELDKGQFYKTKIISNTNGNFDLLAKPTVSDNILFNGRFLVNKNGIILWKNNAKKIAGFLLEDAPIDIEKSGVIEGDYVERLRIFDTYSFQIYDNKGRLEVITEPVPIDNANLRSTFVQEIQGTLRLAGNGYGFISGAFIPRYLIEKFQLHDGDPFSGKKGKTWNRKKGEWLWSIFDDSE